MAVTLYIVSESEACIALERKLRAEGRRIRVVDLIAEPEALPELLKLTGGRRIVPVVVDDSTIRVAPDGGDAF